MRIAATEPFIKNNLISVLNKELGQSSFNSHSDFSSINQQFEAQTSNKNLALDNLLQWGLTIFGDKMVQVTSFGPTGMVILDRLAQLSPSIRIITIDTGFLFAETYALWDEIQRRYPLNLDIHSTSLTPQNQDDLYGPELWVKEPDKCCYLRKVGPMHDALQNLNAWLTGLRRDQSPTRANVPLVAWDNKYDLVKINPLAAWTNGQVWKHILANKIPYNVLHDQGFTSLGCTHCTHKSTNTVDERSGRWRGRQKTECGIHI